MFWELSQGGGTQVGGGSALLRTGLWQQERAKDFPPIGQVAYLGQDPLSPGTSGVLLKWEMVIFFCLPHGIIKDPNKITMRIIKGYTSYFLSYHKTNNPLFLLRPYSDLLHYSFIFFFSLPHYLTQLRERCTG